MRYTKLLGVITLLLAVPACDDSGITEQGDPPPAASVRFINAVPDTGTVDLRFWDRVENLPSLLGVAFRTHSGFYQRVEPGARATRVFPNATDPALTSIFLVDTTLTLSANTRYTMVYAGRAQGGQDRLAVIEDPATPPAPPAGNIALQALHAAQGVGAVDVYVVVVDSAGAATPADWATNNVAVMRNIPFLGKATGYTNVPARPTSGSTGRLYRFVVTETGSTTALFAATPNQPGSNPPAGASYGPQPGVQIAGSALTAVIVGGSIPGTRQSTAANQSPTVFLMVDKVLNP